MPVITMELVRLSKEKKALLVKEVTRVTSEITGLPNESYYVFIKENEPDNVGVGGKILLDMKKD